MNTAHLVSEEHALLDDLVVVVADGLISRVLDGEAVVLNLKSGVYFGLNEVGTRIWQLIQKPKNLQQVCNSLLDEYDVGIDRCKNDVLKVLNQMSDHGLIDFEDGKNT